MDDAQLSHPGTVIHLAWLGAADSNRSEVESALEAANASRLCWVTPKDADVFLTATWPPPITAPVRSRPVVLISEAPVYHPAVVWQPPGRDGRVLLKTILDAVRGYSRLNEYQQRELRTTAVDIEPMMFNALVRELGGVHAEFDQNAGGGRQDLAQFDRFESSSALYSWVSRAIDLARESGVNIRLKGFSCEFVALAGGRLVFVDAELAFLRKVAAVQYEARHLQLTADATELMVNEGDPRLLDFDRLRWFLGLHACDSRWPSEVTFDSGLRLAAWPNIPLIDLPLGAPCLFASWHGEVRSLRELAERAELPLREVAMLMGACISCGLAEVVEPSPDHKRFATLGRGSLPAGRQR